MRTLVRSTSEVDLKSGRGDDAVSWSRKSGRLDVASVGSGDVQLLINQLPPSPQLLKFYRDKVDQLHKRHNQLTSKLDKLSTAVDETERLRQQLTQRDREVGDLQRTLSDLQAYVLQERQRVVQLTAVSDKHQLNEVETRHKMNVLMALSGCTEASVTFFMRKLDEKQLVRQQLPPELRRYAEQRQRERLARGDGDQLTRSSADAEADVSRLRGEVTLLRRQLRETIALADEERQTLLEDRRIAAEEAETDRLCRELDQTQLAKQLAATRRQLLDAARDYVRLHGDLQAAEQGWMAEKDRLLRERELMCALSTGEAPGLGTGVGSVQTAYQRLQHRAVSLLRQLEESQSRCDHYKQLSSRLQKQLQQTTDSRDGNNQLLKGRVCRLRDALQTVRGRYDQLEKRRRLEAEGFRADVALLRNELRAVERRVCRFTGAMGHGMEAVSDDPGQFPRGAGCGPGGTVELYESVRQAKQRIQQMERELDQLWRDR